MKYLLDSNICINHLREKQTSCLIRGLHKVNPSAVGLPSIVAFELLAGAYHDRDAKKNAKRVTSLISLFKIVPFDERCADASAHAFAALAKKGKNIGNMDILIAGVALANHLTLVTHNVSEFARVPGLSIEDWQTLYAAR